MIWTVGCIRRDWDGGVGRDGGPRIAGSLRAVLELGPSFWCHGLDARLRVGWQTSRSWAFWSRGLGLRVHRSLRVLGLDLGMGAQSWHGACWAHGAVTSSAHSGRLVPSSLTRWAALFRHVRSLPQSCPSCRGFERRGVLGSFGRFGLQRAGYGIGELGTQR